MHKMHTFKKTKRKKLTKFQTAQHVILYKQYKKKHNALLHKIINLAYCQNYQNYKMNHKYKKPKSQNAKRKKSTKKKKSTKMH